MVNLLLFFFVLSKHFLLLGGGGLCSDSVSMLQLPVDCFLFLQLETDESGEWKENETVSSLISNKEHKQR